MAYARARDCIIFVLRIISCQYYYVTVANLPQGPTPHSHRPGRGSSHRVSRPLAFDFLHFLPHLLANIPRTHTSNFHPSSSPKRENLILQPRSQPTNSLPTTQPTAIGDVDCYTLWSTRLSFTTHSASSPRRHKTRSRKPTGKLPTIFFAT